MSKTAEGLVSYAKQFVGNPYWYGMFGQVATEALLTAKTKQYPNHYTSERMAQYKRDIAQKKQVFDCVGLIKAYMWLQGNKIVYTPSTDVNANGMLARARVKGNIKTMPDRPGLLVHYSGHIGVYIGGGEVIEAMGFAHGVKQTRLTARKWTSWLECPYISYVADQPPQLTLEVRGKNIPVKMENYKNRTYVELEGKDGQKHMIQSKALADLLDMKITWDAPTQTVKID